jgi:hypothetical protein
MCYIKYNIILRLKLLCQTLSYYIILTAHHYYCKCATFIYIL